MTRLIAILAVMAMPLAASAQTFFIAGIDGAQATADNGCEPVVGEGPSGGIGTGTFTLDLGTSELSFDISFVGLNLGGSETVAHVHGAGAPGVPAGIVFGLPSGTPKIGVSPALSAQNIADLQAGLFYVNIHSTLCPAGELRGQILVNASTPTTYDISVTLTGQLDAFSVLDCTSPFLPPCPGAGCIFQCIGNEANPAFARRIRKLLGRREIGCASSSV